MKEIVEFTLINGPLLDLLKNFIPELAWERISRTRYLSVRMCNVILAYESGRQLMDDNPVLLWLLIQKSSFNYWLNDQMEEILSKSRREILQIAMNKGDEVHVRMLAKIDITIGTKGEIDIISSAIFNERIIEATRHLTKIGVGLLHAMQKAPELTNKSLAKVVSQNNVDNIHDGDNLASVVQGLYQDIVRAAKALAIDNYEAAISRCSSLNDLQRLHDRWVRRVKKSNLSEEMKMMQDLPKAPIPDTETIVSIKMPYELHIEGDEMDHCIMTYLDELYFGDIFVYKVLKPERATLAIVKNQGKWSIKELSLKSNKRPSKRTWAHVEQWLGQNQKS